MPYNIISSFHEFYLHHKNNSKSGGIKSISFPTGIGKTTAAARQAILTIQQGDLPIYIAPKISLLQEFEKEFLSSCPSYEIIRIFSETELSSPAYYMGKINLFKTLSSHIEHEFISFLQKYQIHQELNFILSLPSIHAYYTSERLPKDPLLTNPTFLHSLHIFKAIQTLKNSYASISSFILFQHISQSTDPISSIFFQIYNAINILFYSAHFLSLRNTTQPHNPPLYQIPNFPSIPASIIKDFFGLSFAISEINKHQSNPLFAITLTSQKSLRNISRQFEISNQTIKKISTPQTYELYINSVCLQTHIIPVYYIDEIEDFYHTSLEFHTNIADLNNFILKIQTFFDYCNITSLISFLQKIKQNKSIQHIVPQFETILFNYNDSITPHQISSLLTILLSHQITLTPQLLKNKSITLKINSFIQNNFHLHQLFKSIPDQANTFFILLCFLNNLGISSKINSMENIEKTKNTPILSDLHIALKNIKTFLQNSNQQTQPITPHSFFQYLSSISTIAFNKPIGDTIIKHNDFFTLTENNQFMFGNHQLTLIKEQINYLHHFHSTDNLTDNLLLSYLPQHTPSSSEITLSHLFLFIIKVIIKSILSISFPKSNLTLPLVLDKETLCLNYMKKTKRDFHTINFEDHNLEESPNESTPINSISPTLSYPPLKWQFDSDYIYLENKNIINLSTSNYENNKKLGKPHNTSYLQISSTHIKGSPENTLLQYFSTLKNKTIVPYSSPSVIFLLSATSHIQSSHGNFNFEYIQKNLQQHLIQYDTTYTNHKDINLVALFNASFSSYSSTSIQIEDFPIYPPKTSPLYENFQFFIENSPYDELKPLKNKHQIHKYHEFQSFTYSIEKLTTNPAAPINSLFYITQSTRYIRAFLKYYLHSLFNKSQQLISTFSYKKNQFEKIFIIHKDPFNRIFSPLTLPKDLIIIFYDSQFENNQKKTISDNSLSSNSTYYNTENNFIPSDDINQINHISPPDNFDNFEKKDLEYDPLDLIYHKFKKEIFNEDQYQILLCSSFPSVSKGLNFITYNQNKEKDFDSIYIATDPYYDNLNQNDNISLIHQRFVAMKDFLHTQQRSPSINELMNYYYQNKSYLLQKENYAYTARTIIQSIGRIERRRFAKNNHQQFIFINHETYKKLEAFYHFYEYDRYQPLPQQSTQKNKQDFISNLSINNKRIYHFIQNNMEPPYIQNNLQHQTEQILYVKIFQELTTFILKTLRTHTKTYHFFKEIWQSIRNPSIIHNFPDYLLNLQTIQTTILPIIQKYAVENEYPNLYKYARQPSFSLENLLFLKMPSTITPGLSSFTDPTTHITYHYITDYYHSNYSHYNLFEIIFLNKPEDFSQEALAFIPFMSKNTQSYQSLKEIFTFNNYTYYPQKNFAIDFIKSIISEEIVKNILIKNKIPITLEIQDNSYEIFDFYIPHKDSTHYTAIDVKYLSYNTQALNSKKILQKIHNKSHIINFEPIKEILCINLLGYADLHQTSTNISFSNIFIKNTINSHPSFGKYILNTQLISMIKEMIAK